jgi:hypothetical protein
LGIAKTGKKEDAQLVSETNSQAPSQTLCRTPNPVKLVRKKPSRNPSVNISAQLISESSTGCNESATQQPPVPEAQDNRAVKELLVNAFQAAFASLRSRFSYLPANSRRTVSVTLQAQPLVDDWLILLDTSSLILPL